MSSACPFVQPGCARTRTIMDTGTLTDDLASACVRQAANPVQCPIQSIQGLMADTGRRLTVPQWTRTHRPSPGRTIRPGHTVTHQLGVHRWLLPVAALDAKSYPVASCEHRQSRLVAWRALRQS
eukprot:scaffold352146_cov34-Prasinocladus_malaysianus.AAC.1